MPEGANMKLALGGRYRLIERIGVGGMAAVFLAEDSVLDRQVAVKKLHAEAPEDAARRFHREARLAAGLSHPNLVSVFDAFSDGDDLVIVMEYVAGSDLSASLEANPPSQARALQILIDLAAALDHLHGAGIVHRDVKPSNVLLSREGDTAKLTDLGIARIIEETATTQANVISGSVPYMSPEQFKGETVGPPSDVYAFALVTYEVLSGRRARSGTLVQITHQAVTEPPPDLRDVRPATSAAAAELLQRSLAADPADRPATAGELVRELQRALGAPGGGRAGGGAPSPMAAPSSEPTPALEAVPAAALDRPRPAEAGRSFARRWVPAALALVAALAAVLLILSGGGDPGGDTDAEVGSAPAPATEDAGAGRDEPPPSDDGSGDAPTDAPAAAVEGFYEAAATGDVDGAIALASPALEAQLGGADGITSTFATLESIEFRQLSTLSESAAGAEVELETTATHTDRVEACTGTAALVPDGEAWLVERLNGISCEVVG